MFNQFLLDMKALSPPMLLAARRLLTNQQGGILAQMKVTERLSLECKTLGSIVIHTVAVLFSNSKQPILLPFIKMLDNPASLRVSRRPSSSFLLIIHLSY